MATANVYIQNLMKFRHVDFEICEHTDRLTDRQTDI